jgi:aldehyde:ferredoxin oxidoreductase
MLNGYGGSILRIDLSTGTLTKEPTPPQVARDFLGGRGFGAYFLFKEVPKNAHNFQRSLVWIDDPGGREM